jgi:hypothetical protein
MKTYIKENIITSNPNIPDVINPNHETILDHGWHEYIDIQPEYNYETQRIERVGIFEGVVKYQVIDIDNLEN